jgi:CheY-like chemotaxis protein
MYALFSIFLGTFLLKIRLRHRPRREGLLDDKRHRTSPLVYGGLALASGVIFAVDYVTPAGYAVWLAYVGLVFATVFIDDRRAPWLVAGLSTVLVFLRVLLNPPDVSPEVVLVNRSIGVALLWIAAALFTTFRHVGAPILVLTPNQLRSELFVILMSAIGLAFFSLLLFTQINRTTLSEFVTQNVPGGMLSALLLSLTAIGLFLGRRISNISALYTKALRDKEQSEEQLRLLSERLQKQGNEQTAGPTPYSTPARQKAGIPVLLVDDHVMVRQGLRSVMEGFPNIEIVGEASNGNEALKLVEKRRPAVVLMDINMPKLNGIEATAKIKREHPDIAVIGLSVNAESSNQEAMKKAGASMLLPKEAVVDELYNAIMTVSTELVSKRATQFHPS